MNKFLVSAALAAVVGGAPASSWAATTFVLNDLGGVSVGSDAYLGFSVAAEFWSKRLTNNVTVNLNVGFQKLDDGVLGQAGSRTFVADIQSVQGQLGVTGTSALDAIAIANLPTMTPGEYGVGAITMLTPGELYPGGLGSDTSTRVLDADGSGNNSFLDANSANLKALGYSVPTGADGSIEFSNEFKFDFDPRDGIAADSIDFIGVAIHEIGHVLGFVSGVDIYDVLGAPNGPLVGDPDFGALPLDDFAIASVLDLYRYSGGNTGAVLDWGVGGNPFFSIDSKTPYGGGFFSTGAYNGDGWQASHWRDNLPGSPQLGALDPTVAYGQMTRVTSLDLAAYDAIGWNIDYDVLGSTRNFTSRDAYLSAIPEPGTWALTITGFFLMGSGLRAQRRRGPALAA